MFDYLRGRLIENNISYVVIDVHGVGYKVFVPPGTFSPPSSNECCIYTSFIVRENSQTLYGFAQTDARNLFEMLINVSGVGPKTALCILSQFAPAHFQQAVLSENIKMISAVPGLGKKTAEKIILDLKDKLAKLSSISMSSSKLISHPHHDAISALVNLGFSDRAASKVIDKVTEKGTKEMDLSEMIAQALRQR